MSKWCGECGGTDDEHMPYCYEYDRDAEGKPNPRRDFKRPGDGRDWGLIAIVVVGLILVAAWLATVGTELPY